MGDDQFSRLMTMTVGTRRCSGQLGYDGSGPDDLDDDLDDQVAHDDDDGDDCGDDDDDDDVRGATATTGDDGRRGSGVGVGG